MAEIKNAVKEIHDLQLQSSLAKLLANENITVTHDSKLDTAYFDVKNRVLGLPVWKNKGKVVYDMLVGHEVSHALHTPHVEFEEFVEKNGRKHFDILNIVEDIRIERLIQKKYAGMPRIFKGAYNTLYKDDFFKIEGKDLNNLLFIDRLNLKGKLRDLVDVEFNEEETEFWNRCQKAETFEEVIEIYKDLVEYTKREKEEKKEEVEAESKTQTQPQESEGDESEGYDSYSPSDEGEFSTTIPEAGDVHDDGTESHSIESSSSVTDEMLEEALKEAYDSYTSDDGDNVGSGDASGKIDVDGEDVKAKIEEEDIKSETMESFKENINDEITDTESYGWGSGIALMPKASTVRSRIATYKQILADRPKNAIADAQDYYDREFYGEGGNIEEKYLEFKKNINKKTGVLVREFERRKAAYQYSRAQESRRGSLDVNKLHKYKYDDQIFQTTMRLADAKSHGMIFFIDYSGSMGGVLQDVLEHTLNLIHFCKKVGVPFEVYSFTSNYSMDKTEDFQPIPQSDYEFDMGELVLGQLFSSEMSKAEYEKAFKQVSYQVLLSERDSYYNRFSQYGTSKFEHLGGTPLDATLIAAHTIVKDFEKKNGNQKTNVMILTDGESHHCRPNKFGYRDCVTTINGKKYHIVDDSQTTHEWTRILKKETNATLVGFYLPENRSAGNRHLNRMARNTTRGLAYETAGKWMKQYRKEGFFATRNCFGYDAYFLLDSDIEIKDEEFDFSGSEGKSLSDNRGEQAKLARQFAKHNTSARKNRIIMTKFAEIIA